MPTDRRTAYAISSPLLIFLRSLFICASCTTHSICLYCRIIIQVIGSPSARASPPINWLDRSVHGLYRRPVDWTVRWSLLLNAHFAVDQLTRLFVTHASSPATLGTPRCSNIASYAGDSSVLRHRQLRRGLLGAWTSPATLGTPQCSDSLCKHHQLS